MTKPVVLLDCDGVLADYIGGYLKIMSSLTGNTYSRDQVTNFWIELSPFFVEAEQQYGVGSAQQGMLHEHIMLRIRERGWAQTLAVLSGAVEAVQRLRSVAEVFCLTAPTYTSPTWSYDRFMWLQTHFDFDQDHVIQTHAKHRVSGFILVDDRPEHLIKWCQRSGIGERHAFLVDTPYNRHVEPTGLDVPRVSTFWESMTRTHSLEQVARIVQECLEHPAFIGGYSG